jgi:single-strand DNA-binding protein
MKRVNRVQLEGAIVSDISLRESKKGYSVADFRMIHSAFKAKNPVFIDVEVWGQEAELIYENAQRGSIIFIARGELRRDVWEKDGEPRSKLKITAKKIIVKRKTKVVAEED